MLVFLFNSFLGFRCTLPTIPSREKSATYTCTKENMKKINHMNRTKITNGSWNNISEPCMMPGSVAICYQAVGLMFMRPKENTQYSLNVLLSEEQGYLHVYLWQEWAKR